MLIDSKFYGKILLLSLSNQKQICIHKIKCVCYTYEIAYWLNFCLGWKILQNKFWNQTSSTPPPSRWDLHMYEKLKTLAKLGLNFAFLSIPSYIDFWSVNIRIKHVAKMKISHKSWYINNDLLLTLGCVWTWEFFFCFFLFFSFLLRAWRRRDQIIYANPLFVM